MSTYNVYNGQTNLRVRFTGLGNITGYSTVLIKYRLNGSTATPGQWTATVEDASTGIVYYNLLTTDILSVGTYEMWVHITFSDNRISISDPVEQIVSDEGILESH